jgi:hypothetical protein
MRQRLAPMLFDDADKAAAEAQRRTPCLGALPQMLGAVS